jgi:hypothetical protein
VKPETNEVHEKIRELAISDSLTSSILLVQELKDLKALLSWQLDLLRNRRKEMERDHVNLMDELPRTLRKIQANFRVEAQLLNLIRPDKESSDHVKY